MTGLHDLLVRSIQRNVPPANETTRIVILRSRHEHDAPLPWVAFGIDDDKRIALWAQCYFTHAGAIADLPDLWQTYVTEPAEQELEDRINHAVEVEANAADLDLFIHAGTEHELRQELMDFGLACITRFMNHPEED